MFKNFSQSFKEKCKKSVDSILLCCELCHRSFRPSLLTAVTVVAASCDGLRCRDETEKKFLIVFKILSKI